MDITLPTENGDRVSYRLVGEPVEPRKGAGGPQARPRQEGSQAVVEYEPFG